MRWNRICLGQRFITVLILAIGLNAYGCKDSVSVSEDVQVPLSSLTVTPGTLQPGFFSNTTNYTVNAPTSATSVTVTAIPKDNTATVTINKAVTTHLSVPLGGPGSTTIITIVLEAQNGEESTYTVTVTRLLSSDNGLKTLTVTPGLLVPDFASDQLTYTVDEPTNVSNVTVSATKSDPNAVMLIESILISPITVPGGTPSSGPVNIPLTGPGTNTVVSITITAQNGSKKTYTITVNRAAPSSNNNLSALSVSVDTVTQTLSPTFTPNTTDYTVNVATDVPSVDVTATKSDPNAVILGDLPNEGHATIQLDGPGTSKTVSIIVRAPSGNQKTYIITVNRAAPASDNNLLALTVTPGTLIPVFASSTTTYSVNVGSTITSVTVTATLSDTTATMTINGQGTSSDQARDIPLGVAGSSTEVNITVIAPSSDKKIYLVTVIRPLPSNSDLSTLTVTPGTLVPNFVPSETIYSVNVPLTVDSVTVTATKSDPDAGMSGDVTAGAGTTTGEATISLGLPLIPTTRTVQITVKTQDGISTKTYTVTINRGVF